MTEEAAHSQESNLTTPPEPTSAEFGLDYAAPEQTSSGDRSAELKGKAHRLPFSVRVPLEFD